jgi:hypothetical protein
MAPSHDDPGVSFPMTNLGRGENAFGGTRAQNRQHQDNRCQQSDVTECRIHIQKIHPLPAEGLIEKTCQAIDKSDDARFIVRQMSELGEVPRKCPSYVSSAEFPIRIFVPRFNSCFQTP